MRPPAFYEEDYDRYMNKFIKSIENRKEIKKKVLNH